jgi:APA family basic amino acid/polyamine antiporter
LVLVLLIAPLLQSLSFAKESSGFISAVAFLYISYAGVTKVAAVAGEIKNPEKNLPKTMLISLFLITVVYVLVAIVLVGNVEASLLGKRH